MTFSADTKRRLWFAFLVTLVCWSINAYGLVFLWLAQGTLFARVMNGHPYISDFVNAYDAGVLARDGHKQRIYDFNVQDNLSRKTIAPVVPELPFYSQLPPIYYVYCIPLAFFNLAGAWLLFCAGGLSASFFALKAVIKSCGIFDSGFKKAFVYVAAISTFPVWMGVELGNTSIYLLPCLTLFLLLLKAKKYFWAGLATMLLMVKVQYLPIVFVIGFVLGRLRFLQGAAIAALAATLISTLVLGWDNVVDWPRILIFAETTNNYSGVEPENMQNIRGMLVAFTHQDSSWGKAVAAGFFLSSIASVGFLWWKSYPKLAARNNWAFEICAALSILMMVIFSIHTHYQDYILMALAGTFLYASCEPAPDDNSSLQKKRLRAWLLAYPMLSWTFFIVKQINVLPIQPFAVFAICIACYVYYIWFVRETGMLRK